MKQLPNVLTVGRMVATPIILYCLFIPTLWGYGTAAFLFILAAISDYWDGHLARRYQTTSRFGQFLDPLADKVLVLGTLIVLAWRFPETVSWIAVALVALRDVGITLLRSVVESRGRSLKTLPMAKTKTAIQLTFLISYLLFLALSLFTGSLQGVADVAVWLLHSWIMQVLLWALVLITVGTGLLYLRPEYTR